MNEEKTMEITTKEASENIYIQKEFKQLPYN